MSEGFLVQAVGCQSSKAPIERSDKTPVESIRDSNRPGGQSLSMRFR
jgi:hypothetical protein